MLSLDLDRWHMSRALRLAARGQGRVEPNPMVGCVVCRGAETIGEGWHRAFGSSHAEVEALAVAGPRAAGATLYVTLEPCCHQGKTPPCTQAVIRAGVARVVVAQRDPFPSVAGGGVAALESAGLRVEVGLLEAEAQRLNAPYLKLLATGRPWVMAKWAMTLDGKLASHTGQSQWISGEASRALVHRLRGRVDAIVVGSQTAQADDPLLTARPSGARTACRVVVDSRASLSPKSQLARTTDTAPVLLAVGPEADAEACRRLAERGCEIFRCSEPTHAGRLVQLLDELGRRRMTNLLVEGGAGLLGGLLEGRHIDEVHAFVAPKLIGGAAAPSPIGGEGLPKMSDAPRLAGQQVELLEDDIYLRGRVAYDDRAV